MCHAGGKYSFSGYFLMLAFSSFQINGHNILCPVGHVLNGSGARVRMALQKVGHVLDRALYSYLVYFPNVSEIKKNITSTYTWSVLKIKILSFNNLKGKQLGLRP